MLDWFKTQVVTTRDKESTINLEMCQVGRGDTCPLILIIFCVLQQRTITSLNCKTSSDVMILLKNLQKN